MELRDTERSSNAARPQNLLRRAIGRLLRAAWGDAEVSRDFGRDPAQIGVELGGTRVTADRANF
jgi:hypothetical protein